MGKVKIYRQNLINLIHSVGSKSLFSVLCYDNQHKFGLDPSESKIVAYKSFSYILSTSQSRTGEQIIFPLPEGRNSHQKKSYSSSSKKNVILTVYSHDDLLLLREFGLKEMQNSRIARLMEEAYFQDAVFTLDTLSLLTNISLDSLRDRLQQWNLADINLCVSGQSIKSRGSLLRSSYLIKSFLKGEDLYSIRKFLCYSEDTANHLLINFVRLYFGLRDGLSPTRIFSTATISQHIVEQWCSLIGEFEKLYPQNLSMLEDYFKIQALSTVKADADSIHLIRQITKRSKRLIELHKSLYDRFNIPDYQFAMMRVRSIFANHKQLKSKKNLL